MDAELDEGAVVAIGDVIEAIGDSGVEAHEPTGLFFVMNFEGGEVGGEDEFGLDGGDDEDGHDDPGDVAPDFAADAADTEHGEESTDGDEDAEGDDDGDFVGSARSGDVGWLAHAHAVVNVFADDNGVIHHHAEDEDEGEEGDHVDGDVGVGEDEESACDRDGNAEGDIPSEAGFEEEAEGDDDKDEALEAV